MYSSQDFNASIKKQCIIDVIFSLRQFVSLSMSETAFLFNIKSCLVYRYISVEQYESSLFTVNVLSYTKVSDKMTYANNADPDQTAPEGAI